MPYYAMLSLIYSTVPSNRLAFRDKQKQKRHAAKLNLNRSLIRDALRAAAVGLELIIVSVSTMILVRTAAAAVVVSLQLFKRRE